MAVFRGAVYSGSVHDARLLPRDRGAEVAFAGRSNSGKSSAINAIAGRKRLAYVSRTPGRTQTINFFDLGHEQFLVDLPGYGYAAVSAGQRRHWSTLISAYIDTRSALRGVILVMDARHPFAPLDCQLLEWIGRRGIACHGLLTKADKLSSRERLDALRGAERRIAELRPTCSVQLFSSKSGLGVAESRNTIAKWLGHK